MNDLSYMQEALRLAAEGRGRVSPNPLVGAVIVKDGEIVGRGFHRYTSFKHAEVNAIEDAGDRAKGATLYLNLEPCCHYGRTSPCTDAVLRSGVRRVVAAMADPNPKVAGHGFQILKDAGIEVDVGLCEAEARHLNEKFIKFISTHRPFVHLKVAMTLDGKIATRTGRSRWITGEAARECSQLLRAEYDAILVGVGTVLVDDPELTVRLPKAMELDRHRPLVRIVLDGRLRTPLNSRILNTSSAGPVIIFANNESASIQSRVEEYRMKESEIIFTPGSNGRVSLIELLEELGRRQITSLIVEGGAEVSGQFLAARLIDKVTFFIAPKLVGGIGAVPAVGGNGFETLEEALELDDLTVEKRGRDVEITGYPKLS
jgi:diaminohydroxyphosphoribosylaminopyrimidine deaminase / 5-amino-6-(5-phosphoribosylamino)uracil reductase